MFFKIAKGHYDAAIERIKNDGIEHTPRMIDAIITTLVDFIFNKTIYDKNTGSYLIYEIVNKRTIGVRVANILSVYVPPKHRGSGIASFMIDSIPEDIVIGDTCDDNRSEYKLVGNIYRVR